MADRSTLNNGDKIFIFSKFPYKCTTLPLPIIDGVDLIFTPNDDDLYSLDLDGKDNLFRYVNPLLNVPSQGKQNTCIRISSKIKNQDEVFWNIILALQLIRPLYIGVSGWFKYTTEIRCNEAILYWRFSTINKGMSLNIQEKNKYSTEDFKTAAQIFKKLEMLKTSSPRILMALDSYLHIIMGGSTSYSMLYMELFICLEYLFASPQKDYVFGKVIGSFLKNISPEYEWVEKWITTQYGEKRNTLAHGNPQFWKSETQDDYSVNSEKYSELLKLHEIARFCFLGILGLEIEQLKSYKDTKRKKLYAELCEVIPSKTFLKDQKMFLNSPM